MSASVLIDAVEAEGFDGVAWSRQVFGDVQVAGLLAGRDDGGGDGGQVGGSAAGAAGGIFGETRVADVMVRLDGPVLADQAGQVGRGGVGAGQAGDGVDGPVVLGLVTGCGYERPGDLPVGRRAAGCAAGRRAAGCVIRSG
jgi:hypothetical protein